MHMLFPYADFHHHWDSPLPIGDAFGKGSKPWQEKHGNQLEMWKALRERMGFDI